MEDFEKINQKRKALANGESLGNQALDYFYSKRDRVGKSDQGKNKSLSINVRVSKHDLEVFDFLAEILKEPRASIIAKLLSHDVKAMFNALDMAERTYLAELVDAELTKQNFKHEFRDGTWFWDVAEINQDAYNPVNHKTWDIIRENFKK